MALGRICIYALDPDNVATIQDLGVPKSKKDVRRLLGLLSYYQSYNPTVSEITRPFIELIKKRSPNKISWTNQCEKALYALKQAIIKTPICYSLDFQKPFIIHADASSFEIGACLSQKDKNNQECHIAFINKKLSKCQ